MDALGMLSQQFQTVNIRVHHALTAITPDMRLQRAAPTSNPLGFLLWHMSRSQDWGFNACVRGVPEVARQQQWADSSIGRLRGTGTAFTRHEVDEIASNLDLDEFGAYADEVNAEALRWLESLDEADLDAIPDVAGHLAGLPEYQRADFVEELNSGPEHDAAIEETGGQPTWLFLTSVCVTHLHRHLGEIDLTLGVLTGRAG